MFELIFVVLMLPLLCQRMLGRVVWVSLKVFVLAALFPFLFPLYFLWFFRGVETKRFWNGGGGHRGHRAYGGRGGHKVKHEKTMRHKERRFRKG